MGPPPPPPPPGAQALSSAAASCAHRPAAQLADPRPGTGPVAEEALFFEMMATSIHVSPQQLPRLHSLIVHAAATLGLDPPALYIRQSPSPNAYTLAINGRKPVVVLHTALVELLEEDEIMAVIAHELGHLLCDHGVWLTVANALMMGMATLPGEPAPAGRGLLLSRAAPDAPCR